MKRFMVTVLGAAVFFLGLGALVADVGAQLRSDQKALELIQRARQALGGEAAISSIQSMSIVGRTTHTFDIDGVTRSEQGDMEIALQFPNNLSHTMRFGSADGADKQFSVTMLDGSHSPDAFHPAIAGAEGKGGSRAIFHSKDGKIVELDAAASAEILARTHVDGVGGSGEVREFRVYKKDGEQITAPEAAQVYMRRAEIEAAAAADGAKAHKIIVRKEDGTFQELKGESGDIVIATAPRAEVRARVEAETAAAAAPAAVAFSRRNDMLRTTLALLLTPPKGVDVSYAFGGEAVVDGTPCNIVIATSEGSDYKIYLSQSTYMPVAMSYNGHLAPRVFFSRDKVAGSDGTGVGRTTYKTADLSSTEVMVKYSDYRSVNGVLLPFRWTQSIGGNVTEDVEITNYEINPANISEKFRNQRVFVRSKKADGN